jgi:ABC-2 type transport system permease protein
MYLAFALSMFQTRFAYRAQVWAGVLADLVWIMAVIGIWHSIFGSGGRIAGISLADMVTYSLLAGVVLNAWQWRQLVRTFDEHMKSGDIAVFLLKPLNYPLMMLANESGRFAFAFLMNILPVCAVVVLVYGVLPPASLWHGLLFIAFFFLSFAILFLLAAMIGLCTFYVHRGESLEYLLQGILMLLGGSLVPLWFFPEALQPVVRLLPFAWVGFHPAAVYLGKVDVAEALWLLGAGLVWAALLFALTAAIWSLVRRRLVVHGG